MKDNDNITIYLFLIFITILVVVGTVFKKDNNNSKNKYPYIISTQHGFKIDIDNDIMKLACKHHGIKYNDIRWDTINETFIFIRESGEICLVFNSSFLNYLNDNKDH